MHIAAGVLNIGFGKVKLIITFPFEPSPPFACVQLLPSSTIAIAPPPPPPGKPPLLPATDIATPL